MVTHHENSSEEKGLNKNSLTNQPVLLESALKSFAAGLKMEELPAENLVSLDIEPEKGNNHKPESSPKSSILTWFYNLPVAQKQLLIAATALLSFLVFMAIQALIIQAHYPQVQLKGLVKDSLGIQLILFAVFLTINLGLAKLIGASIVTPIKELEKAAKKFILGEQDTRAVVFAQDEIGQLATTFNRLVENSAVTLAEVKQAKLKAEGLVEEQSRQNQTIQRELLQLLTNVEDASSGDLTVRAEITAGEIGIVADFFNTIVESMREIVTQVKKSTNQVNISLVEDEVSMRALTEDSLKQSKKIRRMLDFVEQMASSIQDVANSAAQAADVARLASQTAQAGGGAMDRTVKSILELRETVGETAKKVKRLGEASQQISKVISLINQIALQTNLLAINASIEAARAGEEGRGFAVVAEEVGELAAQSAAATKEIEQIVENIQRETGEVVKAMEVGTSQVVEGTHLVENAKQSLGQIVRVSRKIDELVQSISTSTVSQSKTSEMVTNLMKDIAKVSEGMSESSRQVSLSLEQTVDLAKQLQSSVETFKVGEEN